MKIHEKPVSLVTLPKKGNPDLGETHQRTPQLAMNWWHAPFSQSRLVAFPIPLAIHRCHQPPAATARLFGCGIAQAP